MWVFSLHVIFPRSSSSLCRDQEKHLCFFDNLLLMRIAWSGLRSSTLEYILPNLVLTPNWPDIAIKIDLLWGKLEKLTEVGKKIFSHFLLSFVEDFSKFFWSFCSKHKGGDLLARISPGGIYLLQRGFFRPISLWVDFGWRQSLWITASVKYLKLYWDF